MEKTAIFIDELGNMKTIDPVLANMMSLRKKSRFSHIEPANRHLRRLFYLVRKRVSDESWAAAWTRLWPVLWRVRIADSGKILGTYWTRKAAIRDEKDYFTTGKWLPGHFEHHAQGNVKAGGTGSEGLG